MIKKLDELNKNLKSEISVETTENIKDILKGVTFTDMMTANNVSIALNNESQKFRDICSKIRLTLGIFVQGLNAYKHFVENNKNIGFSKMDTIIKFNGYKYFSRSQYDKRYLNNPYVMMWSFLVNIHFNVDNIFISFSFRRFLILLIPRLIWVAYVNIW